MLAERLQPRQMLTFTNHVGPNSEEHGPTGEELGHLPQTVTHLALTSAADTISPGRPPLVLELERSR